VLASRPIIAEVQNVLLIVVITNKTSLYEKGPEQDAAESGGAALAAIGHVGLAATASGSTDDAAVGKMAVVHTTTRAGATEVLSDAS